MHNNARFNIVQAPGNGNPRFLVIDGLRTDSGHVADGGRLLSLVERSRTNAIALADRLQAFHGHTPLAISHYVAWGKLFTTFAFPTDDAANAFMAAVPGWGLIGITYDGLRHVADDEDKGRALPRIQTLHCACCGAVTQGRQWHNRDTGYGLCEACVPFVAERSEDLERNYGLANVHYAIHPNQGE